MNALSTKLKGNKIRKSITPWLFVGPAAIILFGVLFIPILNVIGYSVVDNKFINPNAKFIGLENYLKILQYGQIKDVLVFTLIFTMFSVLMHITFGLLLAVAVNSKINKRILTFFRIVFILPWVFTAAVVAIVWQLMMTPQGIMNSVLSQIIGEKVMCDWLGDPKLIVLSLLIINGWRGYPHCMISFLAGLQNIPNSVYEAADVDGAGKIRKFFSITLPQLRPVISSTALLDAIWTMNLFPLIWLTTGGGNGTETIATLTYRFSFVNFEFGKASALAVIGLIVTLAFTILYLKCSKSIDE